MLRERSYKRIQPFFFFLQFTFQRKFGLSQKSECGRKSRRAFVQDSAHVWSERTGNARCLAAQWGLKTDNLTGFSHSSFQTEPLVLKRAFRKVPSSAALLKVLRK